MSDDYHKVAFDGRLQYHELLKEQLSALKKAGLEGDNFARYRILRGLFSSVAPYIRPDDRKKIKELLRKVFNTLSSSSRADRRVIDLKLLDSLDEIEEMIHLASDDLFLPRAGEDPDEIDWDKIMRES